MHGVLAAACACACAAYGQTARSYTIDAIVGTLPVGDGVPASSALLYSPQALAVGPDGAIYVSDVRSGIRKIGPDGIIADLSGPPAAAIAVDDAGAVYYVLGPELYVRQPSGAVVTSRPSDGVTSPRSLTGLVLDRNGNLLIADRGTQKLFRIRPDGSVSLFAGQRSTIPLSEPPNRLAVDASNNIYVSETSRIVRISPDGTVTPVAGNGAFGAPKTGAAAVDSPLYMPGAMVAADSGDLYAAVPSSRAVWKINAAGVIEGAVWQGAVADIALDRDGRLLVLDGAGKIVRLEPDGSEMILAGRDQFDGDGGPAADALLNAPAAVAVDASGSLYIADSGNNRIRKVSSDGIITTIAGNGTPGFGGDGGPASDAQIAGPDFLAIDQDGNLYFSARSYLKVRRIKTDGTIETVSGTGDAGDSGDGGPAIQAKFNSIDGLAVDRQGRVYISDSVSNRVRVVSNGLISTYAGTGERGLAADGMPAASSQLSWPSRLALDREGNLLIYEAVLSRFALLSADTGAITTYGGNLPFRIPADDLAAERCTFAAPLGLAFDVDSTLIASNGSAICRITPDGVIHAVAGSRFTGFAGDGGPAGDALLWNPSGFFVDGAGSILFADSGNHRVRKLTPDTP